MKYYYLLNGKIMAANEKTPESNLDKFSKLIHPKVSKKTSKYPGVSWSKMMNKWYAQIRIENKTIPIGYFNNEKEAYDNYKQFLKTQNIINKYGTTK